MIASAGSHPGSRLSDDLDTEPRREISDERGSEERERGRGRRDADAQRNHRLRAFRLREDGFRLGGGLERDGSDLLAARDLDAADVLGGETDCRGYRRHRGDEHLGELHCEQRRRHR